MKQKLQPIVKQSYTPLWSSRNLTTIEKSQVTEGCENMLNLFQGEYP